MKESRLKTLFIFFLVIFSLLIMRLGWLSFIKGDALAARASNQRTQKTAYYQYGRGDFLDTFGRNITGHLSPCLVAFPSIIEDEAALAAELSKISSMPEKIILSKLAAGQKQGGQTIVLKNNLSLAELTALNNIKPLGVSVLSLISRYKGNTAIHLLGSLIPGERQGEYVGKSGLELRYDSYLKGRGGPQVAALVDERGRQLAGNGFVMLEGGKEDTSHNIILTLDLDFQQKTEEALKNYEGAAVVLDVNNGDILALASSPGLDPYGLTEPATDDAYVNKALSYYPPASTFKILLAAAALEEGLVLEEDYICAGYYTLDNGKTVKCWKEGGHGPENLTQALANSCNAYFIDLGLKLGGEKIKYYASLMGLDRQIISGFALEEAKNINFNSNIPGDIANISIGENGVSSSPLQVAEILSIIANTGKRVYPRLVKEVINSRKEAVLSFPIIPPRQILNPGNAAKIRDMLIFAVKEGTAVKAGLSGVKSGGKTGTSQDKGVWFAGFAPADNPLWAVAVYIENGSAGGKEGAEVFAEIIKSFCLLRGIED